MTSIYHFQLHRIFFLSSLVFSTVTGLTKPTKFEVDLGKVSEPDLFSVVDDILIVE